MSFQYGQLVPTGTRNGVTAFVSNVQAECYDDDSILHDGNHEPLDEACILLCRKSLSGVGMMHVIPLRDFHRLVEGEDIDVICSRAATELYGNPLDSDRYAIAELIQNSMDTLFNHPPESTLQEQVKKATAQLERDGLYLKVNDQVVVDAR